MEEWQLAYMAGLIDGEGSISIIRAKSWGRQKHDSYKLILQVAMNSEEPLNTINGWFGGNIITDSKIRKAGQSRLMKSWRVWGDSAAYVLSLIRPYLLLKRKQADLAMEFREYESEFKWVGGAYPSEEVYEMREYFHKRMHKINKGIDDGENS